MSENLSRVDRRFWQSYSRYWNTREESQAVRGRVEHALNRLVAAGAEPGQRIFDAGCGTGVYSLAMAQAGFRVTGVDIADEALERARIKAAGLNLKAEFEQIDLDRPFWYSDSQFDHALCSATLHLVGRPGFVLQELRRIIRPGGLLLVTLWLDPVSHRQAYASLFDEIEERDRLSGRMWQFWRLRSDRAQVRQAHYWTAAQFETLLKQQGYDVLELAGTPLLTALARVLT